MDSTKYEQIKKSRRWIGLTIAFVILVGAIVLVLLGYRLNWSWTGFNASLGPNVRQYQSAKTLWDWLQLCIIPVGLALAAFMFNSAMRRSEQQSLIRRERTEHEIASDNQREELLQTYLDRMSDLLLNNQLLAPDANSQVRDIARARTLTALSMLDANRRTSVLHFLFESGLISKQLRTGSSIVSLREANLSGIDLSRANLREADLSGADLSGSILSFARLEEADLSRANLSEANLTGANLSQAVLVSAKLGGAKLNGANMKRSCLQDADLRGADLFLTNLSRADLRGTNLSKLYLIDSTLDDPIWSDETTLDGAILSEEQSIRIKQDKQL